MCKYYLKAGLLPTLIVSYPLWVLVNNLWTNMRVEFGLVGSFPLLTELIFYISLLVFFSQFINLVSIMFAEMIFGVNVVENAVEKLLQKGTGLVDQWKRALHAKLITEFVVGNLLEGKSKQNRKLARRVLYKIATKMSGSLINSPALSRCALNYLLARALIGFCFSHAFKLLIDLAALLVNHQHIVIEKYVAFFVAYGIPIIFSRRILRKYGLRYARKFEELFNKQEKASRPKQLNNDELN